MESLLGHFSNRVGPLREFGGETEHAIFVKIPSSLVHLLAGSSGPQAVYWTLLCLISRRRVWFKSISEQSHWIRPNF